jgi:ferrochelatase
VEAALAGFPDPQAVEVVFSAHSIPMEAVERGDPYPRQVERTVELVWKQGGWPNRYELCYQSKVGPSRWLRPMLKETLEKLAARRAQQVLVVPISFVSDHVETLYEIAIEHREIAHRLGIRDFRMMPGLNDSPHFIGALAQLVRRVL